ncbi:acetyl xylan esterase [Coprinopsis cinerea AmutBmut pab1-1]|nr:acetyl xylan esterase [Coprinopsis cinerea AmutBmut pab1-1]
MMFLLLLASACLVSSTCAYLSTAPTSATDLDAHLRRGSPTPVPLWGQCGGINHFGSTSCEGEPESAVCSSLNDWYWMCMPQTKQPSPTTPPPSVITPPPPVIVTPPPFPSCPCTPGRDVTSTSPQSQCVCVPCPVASCAACQPGYTVTFVPSPYNACPSCSCALSLPQTPTTSTRGCAIAMATYSCSSCSSGSKTTVTTPETGGCPSCACVPTQTATGVMGGTLEEVGAAVTHL